MIKKYFIVGGICYLIDVGVFLYLTTYLELHWFNSATISFLFATTLNYFLSIKFVFKSGIKFTQSSEYLLVLLVSSIGLLATQITLYISIELFEVTVLLSKIYSSFFVFFWNYLARKNIIFKN